MSVSVAYRADVTVNETLPNNTGSAKDSNRVVIHDQYNEDFTLNAASTPPATLSAEFLLTLSGGAATIDLRALVGTNGAIIDGNGLKPQIIRIKNLGANIMTFTEGAANGYPLQSTIVVHPGGHVQIFTNDGIADIAAADKTIDVAGTGAQTAEVTIVMG